MLDIGLNQVDTSILPSRGWAPALPATSSERMALEFKAYRLGSMSYAEEFALHDAYEKSIEQVRTATGENISNPLNYSPHEIPAEFFTVFGKNTPSRGKQELTLAEAIARAREIDPTIQTIEETKQGVRDRAKAAVNEAFAVGEVSSPWTGPAAFLGTVSGAMTDPVNLASLPLGAPARISGSVALRTLKAMAIEGAIGAGSQAAIEMMNKDFQASAGIESSSLANILAAGVGASVLAGGLRGLSEFVSSRSAAKLGLTLDQLDSLAIVNRYADDIATAPRGVDVDIHLSALDEATIAVSRMEPIVPSGPFSLRQPVVDAYTPQINILRLRDEWISSNLAHMPPEQTIERANLLARVDAVEAQLRSPDLAPDQRRALSNRRDELLADTTPDKLRAEARVTAERRAIENERAALSKEINRLETERALDPGWEPAPISKGRQIKMTAQEEVARIKTADPKIADEGALGEARRIAATDDPLVYSSAGAGRRASDVIQEAAEKKRVANEIANACLLAGAVEL